MCGIAGFNWKDEGLGQRMSNCLVHRGPDAASIFSEEGITLSHRRLAVIDLSQAANQPMFDNKGELVIIFNGEIYNFENLKKNLSSEYEFKTQSDTEVILAGYRKWGKDVVEHLNGIFSFAIWDKSKQALFCARDHLGVKPFYYFWDGSRFVFASEVKAILEHDIERKLDMDSFNDYLRVLYVPEPRTMIKGISKLPPGSTLWLKDKSLEIERYYKPKIESRKWNYNDAKKEVRETIERSVERQLIADVPVGVYLSGGIDSSSILAAVSRVKNNAKTFSVGFELEDGEEREKFNRDFELARLTSQHFGASHHPLLISSKDVADSLESVIGEIDDPISNPTAIPMAYLSRFAKKEVTVILSGGGGDELFGGYERYRLSVISDTLRSIPGIGITSDFSSKAKKLLVEPGIERFAQFQFEKDFRLKNFINPLYWQENEIIKGRFKKYISNSSDHTDDLMLTDLLSWLPDQSFALSDRMSMLGSVEERVPLLDREVVDLSMSLPRSFKVSQFKTKIILKDAFKDSLPSELFKEPKRGWFSPGAKWLRRPEITRLVREVLSPGYNKNTQNLLNWEVVQRKLEDHINKREYNLTIIWALVTFQIWAKKYNIYLPG